jgi:hypothetical protein
MEIVSYVLDGALEHEDSLGNSAQIRPGELQRMSAGTGVTHSEYNPSRDAPVHFLQIWILPERLGLPPSYEQRAFPAGEARDRLRLVASRDGREGSLTVHQDVALHLAPSAAARRFASRSRRAGTRGCRSRAETCGWAARRSGPATARRSRVRQASSSRRSKTARSCSSISRSVSTSHLQLARRSSSPGTCTVTGGGGVP